ncbi:MAG TPA: hypothetical protein VGI19_17440 [Candidatus Cybelea sp.]|jgi:hypothetical protein
MPNADVSGWNAGAMLGRWNIKVIDIVNMTIAATALGFSLYAAHQARTQERNTELFGGFILGYHAADLELCETGDDIYLYGHCDPDHPVTSADFKSLNPILDSLLQIPLDWPPDQPRKPNVIGNGIYQEAAPDVITSALEAHYSDHVVQSAFQLGSAMRWLLALSGDPAISTDSLIRANYLSLAKNANVILSSKEFKGVCIHDRFKSDLPTNEDVRALDGCLQLAWVQDLETPTPAPETPSPTPSPRSPVRADVTSTHRSVPGYQSSAVSTSRPRP